MRPSLVIPSSQDYVPGSQDFITPKEQQYETAPEAFKVGHHHLRSPAQLSPNRIKRPRNMLGNTHPTSMEYSQPSQSFERSNMEPPSTSGYGAGEEYGGPRKLVRTRQPSPPCARNVFVDGPEDSGDISKFPRRPPFVSRYRAEYREMTLLGQGNFSKVFRVCSKFDGLEYAIKRSFREAMAMAAAGTHPNIVRYYSSWTEQQGDGQLFYILMEKCDESLGHKQAFGDRSFKEADLLEILRQVAEALQHLHARGIVHMDVKPDNIYTTKQGIYKLGDFGLATCRSLQRNVALEEGDSRYIPLEVLNDDFGALDRADMFMLGASLYELATGTQLPKGGDKYQEIRQGKLMLMPTFTSQFQKMVKSLMAPVPAERPTPARVLASALLTKRSAARDSSKENYGALPLQPSH
ncbi:Wee1-like protein kinase [Coccomyxa sp. Obi]|nr:Wee1-like protein kinase [Coccomyxa sp. Obi]